MRAMFIANEEAARRAIESGIDGVEVDSNDIYAGSRNPSLVKEIRIKDKRGEWDGWYMLMSVNPDGKGPYLCVSQDLPYHQEITPICRRKA